MPHSKQAAKRHRQSEKRRILNKARTSRMKTEIKKTLEAIEAKDVERAKEQLRAAMKRIDKAAKRHVIHRNNAARKKSALSRKLRELEQPKAAG